jgi:serine phosphatase RsbU (regulator of sigma subunit)/FixJ family two-component response regulator/anti-sigma regulatory factor (Ser/Thr protein kinase)
MPPAAAASAPTAAAEAAEGSGAATAGATSLLLVDDDEASLRALSAVLEPLGQRLVSASSGEEALRRLLHEEFAAILLDVRMPGLDGLETARYINARARTRHTPIIFLTAHARDVEQVSGAYAAGAVDYVLKPFDPQILRSKVSVFVELHRERTERVREARARAEAEAIATTASKLQGISDAALAHLELEDLVPEILVRARSVWNADAAALLLGDDDLPSMSLVWGDGGMPHSEWLADNGATGVLAPVMNGSLLHIPHLRRGQELPGVLATSGLRSLIAAPLSAAGRPFGALCLGSRELERFGEEDLTVLELGASRAAIAIQHARSYEHERELVEVLQHHLLPERLPEAPALTMAARYRTGERATQVGGDWYDAIVLPRGRIGLAIGDVVGHGVRAAALMGELRAALRAYALTAPDSPAEALRSLRSLVLSTHGPGMVATVLYLVVDPDGGRMRFASAGHLPPLLLTVDGTARLLELSSAPPLGVPERSDFADREEELPPGGTLLLYTDGLVERRGEPIDVGLQAFCEVAASGPHGLEQLCSHILTHAPSGASTRDDVALLAARRTEADHERLLVALPAEPESVPRARHGLERWLAGIGHPREDISALKLAVTEACANAVRHAYGPHEAGSFRVTAERQGEALVIEVADSGRWRRRRASGGGLGISLMESLVDRLDIERTAAGTTVRMRRSSSPPAS